MTLSQSTQAILLLTAHFPGSSGDVRPLTPTEWGKFAQWLHDHGSSPSDLLDGPLGNLLSGWSDEKITVERLQALLERGQAMALATEKWFRSGLWVLTRQDAEYPRELKRRLGRTAPPVLFGAGDRSILRRRALAVVGSRKAVRDDLDYARVLGECSAEHSRAIVSGGAKGIDETAMLGALEHGGLAIGVLAEGLLRASSSRKFRQFIRDERLLLVSPFSPEARFNVGNAMQRNKYIYCLSEAAVVVHSGTSGGTWTGAKENLKKRWVPLWVKPSNDTESGNAELVDLGGQWAESSREAIRVPVLLGEAAPGADEPMESATPPVEAVPSSEAAAETTSEMPESEPEGRVMTNGSAWQDPAARPSETMLQDHEIGSDATSLYALFLDRLQQACGNEELRKGELVQRMQESERESDLTRKQVEIWINKAVEDGLISKRKNPVRYQWSSKEQQYRLFKKDS